MTNFLLLVLEGIVVVTSAAILWSRRGRHKTHNRLVDMGVSVSIPMFVILFFLVALAGGGPIWSMIGGLLGPLSVTSALTPFALTRYYLERMRK
ncbi:hypothetical protein [Phenylobacterium hankyongense]|uniref:hypothetical protein n=1 Tax=Phenylobacterium hankyongense TaxID=1813876 RepID=UPI0010578A55|nr:hypothetical protein [Phenylobacterium hankyongense]